LPEILVTKELAFFTKNNIAIVPPTHRNRLTFLFLQLSIKLGGRHLDTIDVTEAEPQAVPNALTEHDFQDSSKKMA
jgi:hypothetical protein